MEFDSKKRKNAPKKTNHNSAAPEPVPFTSPSFKVDDEAGYKYLEEHGYAVFTDVLTKEELEKGRELAWEYLGGLTDARIDRNDPKTWDQGWPDPFGKGIIVASGAGQSSFLWYVRGIENVQKIYKTIWKTDQVVTSFDGFCMHRPFEYNSNWLTKSGWYHVDQNGKEKPNRICIQGLVNFYDAGETDGGLVVVPDSCNIFNSIFENRKDTEFKNLRSDFVRLDKNTEKGIWKNEIKTAGLRPIKINAPAGSMLLWDSRTIHCNSPASTARPLPEDGSVLSPRRLVAYVCMTPLSRLSISVKEKRKDAYYNGHTTSHWPEECNVNGRKNTDGYKPVVLTDAQKALIPLPLEK